MASIVSAGTTSATSLNLSADTSGVLQLASNNGTVALTIATTQFVNIGTASSLYPLQITTNPTSSSNPMLAINPATGTNASYIYFNNSGSGGFNVGRSDSAGAGSGLTLTAYDSFVATTGTTGISFHTNNTKAAYITSGQVFQFNNGYGSVATAYGCRAWGQLQGNSLSVTASGNISSITQNSTGNYIANFTTSMPDANYSCVGNAENLNDSVGVLFIPYNYYSYGINFLTVSNTASYVRARVISLAVFR